MLTTFVTKQEQVLVFIAAGFLYMLVKVYMLVKAPPKFINKSTTNNFILLQICLWNYEPSTLEKIALFFIKAGIFVFGSGLAIIPFLHTGVVTESHWLTEQQFLDAVAVAMITPGPVIITVGFIGYLVAGFSGASVASLATFLPCYMYLLFYLHLILTRLLKIYL